MLPSPNASPNVRKTQSLPSSFVDSLDEWESNPTEISERRKGKQRLVEDVQQSDDEWEDEDGENENEKEMEPDETDYLSKYPVDAKDQEMAPHARVWKMYIEETNKMDTKQFEEWRDGLDVLVVFAALFTIVVCIFVSQTFQRLGPDFTTMTSILMAELVEIERCIAEGITADSIGRSILDFSPKAGDLWFNGLWFASIATSLSIAVVAMIVKQWIRQYMNIPSADPRDCVRIRHYRFMALNSWHVPGIIAILPVVMHISLALFFAGLVIFMFSFDEHLAMAFATMSGGLLIAYTISVMLPLFVPGCSYKTTLSYYSFSTFSGMHSRFFRKGRKVKVGAVALPEDSDNDEEEAAGRASIPSLKKPVDPATATERLAINTLGPDLDYNALSWLSETSANESIRSLAMKVKEEKAGEAGCAHKSNDI